MSERGVTRSSFYEPRQSSESPQRCSLIPHSPIPFDSFVRLQQLRDNSEIIPHDILRHRV